MPGPRPPTFGSNVPNKTVFLWLPYLKTYIDSKLYDYSDFLPQPLGNDFKLSTNIFEKPVH